MGWQKSIPALGIRSIILCPAVVILFGLSPQLPLQSYPELQVSLKFPPTARRPDVPPRTTGAGTRWIPPDESQQLLETSPDATSTPDSWRKLDNLDSSDDQTNTPSGSANRETPQPSCTQQSKIPLTVLMPTSNVGTTVAANPTFFLYVPETTAATAEFVIVDDNRNDVYRTTLVLSSTPGIVTLKLPETVSLKTGKNYLWQFEIICDPLNRQTKDKKYVQGLVQRVEISQNLKTKLDYAVSPIMKAKLYAEAGIWHEALTLLAQVRSYQPTEWEELLKSVGLDALAPAPLVKCCTVEK